MSARQAATSTTTSNGRSLQGSIESLADSAEQAVHSLRERVEPSASRWATQAEDLAHRGINAARQSSEQLRERALAASDRSLQYVKAEPVKSVLIAAAAGALLMAVLSASRSRRNNRSSY
ncbi:MAG TPA: hypothetical protein VFR90_00450 [Methylibium sp.]|uniref:hypothetical protein n=1 Tax=Methylibium sp. TaxID=2067992 RepID=UPI002DB90261|nr:hypothetical protein [Methylibium sp.]HEU4457574.1 hypothetical protein [Methylibium sp.]